MNILEKEEVWKCRPFSVEKIKFNTERKEENISFHRLSCPDWINVMPVTLDKKVVLVKQPRVGSESITLETPGGVVEAHEMKDTTQTALRELEEETGYTSRRILSLGSFHANPAMQNNRVHYFLALDCFLAPDRKHFPDKDESIETVLYDLNELENLIRFGQISATMSGFCFFLAKKYLTSLN